MKTVLYLLPLLIAGCTQEPPPPPKPMPPQAAYDNCANAIRRNLDPASSKVWTLGDGSPSRTDAGWVIRISFSDYEGPGVMNCYTDLTGKPLRFKLAN